MKLVAGLATVAGTVLAALSVAFGASLEDTLRVVQPGADSPSMASGFGIREIGSAFWARIIDIEVRQPYAYAVQPYGLVTFDITDPSAPVELSRFRIPGGATSVALYGDYVLVTSYYGGLSVIDVTDPRAPKVDNL